MVSRTSTNLTLTGCKNDKSSYILHLDDIISEWAASLYASGQGNYIVNKFQSGVVIKAPNVVINVYGDGKTTNAVLSSGTQNIIWINCQNNLERCLDNLVALSKGFEKKNE